MYDIEVQYFPHDYSTVLGTPSFGALGADADLASQWVYEVSPTQAWPQQRVGCLSRAQYAA